MSKTADDFLGSDAPRGNGCYMCGEQSEIQIQLTARQLQAGGVPRGKTRSRSRSFCAKHAIAAFNKMEKELD